MADLMAKNFTKPLNLKRGDEVRGKLISFTDSDAVFDIAAKAEGIINKRNLPAEMKIGDSLNLYVDIPENDSGQIILTLQKEFATTKKPGDFKKWQKFVNAMQRKSQLKGKVTEVNKGGLVVELPLEGGQVIRGFLPNSHLSLSDFAQGETNGLSSLVGQDLSVSVIEVDPGNNRLILSARKEVSEETKRKVDEFTPGQKVKGSVVAIVPFGIMIDLGEGVEGIVHSQEVSWNGDKDALEALELGSEIEAKVIGKDDNLGKVNLSVRQLTEDPFEKLAEDFQTDDVVSGTVEEVGQNGISVKLQDEIDGFLPISTIELGSEYTIGQKANFLVDNVDKNKRRINLVPFITSTKGLIYK